MIFTERSPFLSSTEYCPSRAGRTRVRKSTASGLESRVSPSKLLLILFALAAAAQPLPALDPERHITDYVHTAWRMQDGVFNSAPSTIVQTPDGYMWAGTANGILQFDGVQFAPWMPGHGQRLPNSEVLRVTTTPDGSVWIIGLGFLSRWKGNSGPCVLLSFWQCCGLSSNGAFDRWNALSA